MRPNKHLVAGVIFVTILLPLAIGQGDYRNYRGIENDGCSTDDMGHDGPSAPTPSISRNEPLFVASDDTVTGSVDSVNVRHSRCEESGTVRARTDSETNTGMNITIDEENGWFASRAEVEVNDLRRIYALNGTFDHGVDPWVASMTDLSGQIENATYNSTLELVTVSNIGEHRTQGGKDEYTHYLDTLILWKQTIANSPLSTNFTLNFDFLYASGPIDRGGQDIWSDAHLVVYIDNTLVFNSLLFRELNYRNTWYSASQSIGIPTAPANFELKIGMYFDGTFSLKPTGDYDADGFPDGRANAEKIELWFDSIEFKGLAAPGFEEVDMRFQAGALEAAITGTGSAVITNPSFWNSDPLQVEVTSNTTVIFNYRVTVLLHQYVNSTWGPDPMKPGVAYAIAQGKSAYLRLYTYVPVSFLNLNVTIDIEHPSDWANGTVFDPLLNDLTGSCDISQGLITIPSSFMNRVGWWEIRLQSPNYAKNVTVQKYDSDLSEWTDSTVFRAGNETRAHVQLGTPTSTPIQGSAVHISWFMPDNTVWKDEYVVSMADGELNGSSLTFGGENTTVGPWNVQMMWTNGTEIAFAAAGFYMYHASSLTAVHSVIETEAGSVITSTIRYMDADNGEYLLQDEGSVTASWPAGSVSYDPNVLRGWWEAHFNTSEVGGGEFLVVVNAEQSYYDDASCQFTLKAFYRTTLDVTSIGGLLATTDYLQNYTVYMTYLLTNGSPVGGAEVTFEYTGPDNGLMSLGWRSHGNGNYSLSIKGIVCGLYAVTVTATKQYHYSESDTFTLLVAEANTALSSLNGTSDVVMINESYRLVVHYENSSGIGIAGADIVIDGVSPSSGLTHSGFTYAGNGNYYTDLTPELSGTYTLMIRASFENHIERVMSFALTATVTPTVLSVSTSTAIVTMDQTYTVQLLLLDDESNPVTGATITVLNPPAGLLFQDYVPLPSGYYNVTIIPLQTGTYQIAFRASLVNCLNSTVGFVLVADYVLTSLLIQGSVPLITTGLNEEITLYVTYKMLNGTPVEGATITLNYIGPQGGIAFLSYSHLGLGNYSFALRGVGAGLYTVTLTGSMEYLYPALDSFTLLVIETGTSFTSLNGTSSLVRMGQSFRLVVHYENSTGRGLAGATITLEGVTPASGLLCGAFTYLDKGDYYIDLTPVVATTYTLVIRASLYNHADGVVAFTLTALLSPTVLTSSTSGGSIAIDQVYTVQLLLLDEESNPVLNATITALSPPSGLVFQDCVQLSGGHYSITIMPLQTGTYQIAFKASCENYQYSTIGFTLNVDYVPTSLTVLGGASSGSVLFGDDCEITVVYLRTDLNLTVEVADFEVTTVPETGITYWVTHTTDGYLLRFRADAIGLWRIFISSNKTGCAHGFLQFDLEVRRIPTTINEISLVNDLVYGRPYNFTFSYLIQNGTGIEGASVSVVGPGAQWVEVIETGAGRYRIVLTPGAIGPYDITLLFEREGCEDKSSFLSFVVVPVVMSIVDVEGLDALEGENTTLRLRLIDKDTGRPIEGASVLFQIVTPTGPGNLYPLREASPGTYTATLTMPSFGTSHIVRIYASLENHELDVDAHEAFLQPSLSEAAQLGRTLRLVSPFVFILLASMTVISLQRMYAGRKRKWNIHALSIKRRFDDLRSLLGVIVLDQKAGLPVFSKILKTGLDESLVAGFISAISHFRTELGVDQVDGAIIPISDIIRVVKTKNLICAFITLGPPSESQESKFLRFSRSVGMVLDSMYESLPSGSVGEEFFSRYEKLFDEFLDGHLLHDYRYTDERKPPRALHEVAEAKSQLSNPDKFNLEALALEVMNCGLEEKVAYVRIVNAIEQRYLVPLRSEDEREIPSKGSEPTEKTDSETHQPPNADR